MKKILELIFLFSLILSCEKVEINSLEKQFIQEGGSGNNSSLNGPKDFVFYSSYSYEMMWVTDWGKQATVLRSSVYSAPSTYAYNDDYTIFAFYYNGYLYVYDMSNGNLLNSKYFGYSELHFDFEKNTKSLIIGGSFSGLYRYFYETNTLYNKDYTSSYRTYEKVTGVVIDKDDTPYLTIQYLSGSYTYYRFIRADLDSYSYTSLDFDFWNSSFTSWRLAISYTNDMIRLYDVYYGTYSYYKYPYSSTTSSTGFVQYKYDIYLSGGKIYYLDSDSGNPIYYSGFSSTITKIYL